MYQARWKSYHYNWRTSRKTIANSFYLPSLIIPPRHLHSPPPPPPPHGTKWLKSNIAIIPVYLFGRAPLLSLLRHQKMRKGTDGRGRGTTRVLTAFAPTSLSLHSMRYARKNVRAVTLLFGRNALVACLLACHSNLACFERDILYWYSTIPRHGLCSGKSNWILHRKLKFSICFLTDVTE